MSVRLHARMSNNWEDERRFYDVTVRLCVVYYSKYSLVISHGSDCQTECRDVTVRLCVFIFMFHSQIHYM